MRLDHTGPPTWASTSDAAEEIIPDMSAQDLAGTAWPLARTSSGYNQPLLPATSGAAVAIIEKLEGRYLANMA